MLKKHINKFLIVLLCFALLPLSLFNTSVAFASDVETVCCGAKYMYYTNDTIAEASSNQVQISVKTTNQNDEVVIYEEGKQKEVQSPVASIVNAKGYITILFSQEGNFTVTTSVKEQSEPEYTFVKLFAVTKDVDLCNAPTFTTDVTKLNEYQAKVENATYEEGDTTKPLYQGDKYEVPSIKEIVNAGSLGFEMYTRRLYVAIPGSSSYSQKSSVSITNTTTQLTFTVDSAGRYRYYVAFESDVIDGKNRLSLNADGLVEMIQGENAFAIYDGFYRAYKNNEELIATKTVNKEYTFVLKSDEETEVEASEITSYELIIPTFTFEIETGNPPRASYNGKIQENGYVGLSYTISPFSVSGYKTQETYVLKYTKNYDATNDENNNWVVVEDGFDPVTMSFVPENIGYYKVVLEVDDGYDNETVIVESLVVKVLNEPIYPKFKTSFGEWVSANTMPFVCLCISFGCLVAIVCLIFIKPKQKKTKVEEEDK